MSDSNRQRDLKISDMTGVTTLNSTDLVTIVQNGQNVKMAFSDFTSNLGVTGTLVQQGAVTGTPILDKAGSVNNIRNIESGSGIIATVSAENGVNIAHNFTQDTTGSPVLVNPTSSSPTIASLEAGDGISVGSDGGKITISATGATTSSKTILVNELSDLPTPVAEVITLSGDTEYLFTNDVSLGTNRLVMGADTVISGSDNSIIDLTYTGTATMLSGTNISSRLKNISLTATAVGSKMFDLACTGVSVFEADNCQFNAYNLGDASGYMLIEFDDCDITVANDGLDFSSTNGTFLTHNCRSTVNGGTLWDLGTATFDAVTLVVMDASIASGATYLNGAAAGANINSGGLGFVNAHRFSGLGTSVSGIAVEDDKWGFRANSDLNDTFTGNALFRGDITISKAATDGILVDPDNPTFGWHDLIGRIDIADSGTTRPPLATFLGSQRYRQFDTTGRRWQLTYHLPHDYVPGTDVFFHVHWAHNSASVTTGNVNFQAIASYAKGHNQEAFVAEITNTFGEAASTTQYQHMVTEVQISVSGGSGTQLDTDLLEVDGEITIDLRLSSNTMDGGGIPFFLDADIHYQSNSVATKQKAPNFYV